MQASLLSLPAEIRLAIYALVFGSPIEATLHAGKQDLASNTEMCRLPSSSQLINSIARSAQISRVCKTICLEADHLLYANTAFHIMTQASAGRMPATLTDSFPAAQHVKSLVWQLNCDLLKHLYVDEMRLVSASLALVNNLEIRCRS